MNVADLVGIHEAGIAHHVAAVRQIDRQDCAAAMLDRAAAVVVQFFIVVSRDVAAGKLLLDPLEELHVDRHHVFEMAVHGTILDHPDLAIALDDLGFDLTDLLVNQDSAILLAADDRFARLDHAVRTQRIGLSRPTESRFVFCHDFSSGFSVHFGVNEGFGLYLFTD